MCNTYFLLCSKLSTGKTQVSHELSIDKTAKSYHLHRIFLASLPHILPTLRTQDVQQVVISHLNNIYINIYDKVEMACSFWKLDEQYDPIAAFMQGRDPHCDLYLL